MSSEIVAVLLTSSSALLLGYFHGPEQIALFRVVVPVAALNYLVRHSFSLLYTPQAARLFAGGDIDGIRQLYWQSTMWMAVLTFPILALTFGAAESVVVLLYGERYAESGVLLAVMALGAYLQVALGLSHLTLRAIGKVRLIVIVDVLATVTFLGLNLILIPRYGPLGAAIGGAASLVAYTAYRSLALHKATGVSLFGKEQLEFYSVLSVFTVALASVQLFSPPHIYVAVPLVSIISLCFFMVTRKHLQISQTFPELRRVRVMRWAIHDSQ